MKVKISVVVLFATLLAASLAFGDGYNLVSWPLIPFDTGIQAVMADSMGQGVQITGGNNPTQSDGIKWFDPNTASYLTAWYKTGGPGPDFLWKGTLTTIEADKGYFITIRGTHPAVTLTMTGSVNTATRNIPIEPAPTSPTFNYVGYAFATPCSVSGLSGDDADLLASGYTGGNNPVQSDGIKWFDGSAYHSAWYKTGGPGPDSLWKGDMTTLDPGNGFIVTVKAGHAFTGDTWVLDAPPSYSKGAMVMRGGRSRVSERQVARRKDRYGAAPATTKSLSRVEAVENKKSR
jgi:hypothetical protein